ncbi:MAG: altronate dehydratase [Clostridiales bacterium]|nr:altronate dehydratase [Clostridiales bacterium]
MSDSIVINQKDNVGVNLITSNGIPAGHKYALKDIKRGEYVIKYGEIIGRATCDIKKGEWVHSNNLKSHLDEDVDYSYDFYAENPKTEKGYFYGYKRKKGNAGIRNEIYIIPTVGCVNNVCKLIENECQKFISGSVDGIFALTHQFGCSQLGEDGENIKKLLCSIALNPNATYVVFVGLGCENNSLQGVKDYMAKYDRDNVYYFNCQDIENEVEYGVELIRSLSEKAKLLQREKIDLNELCIGLKCGGSDGFSGLTANPLVGKIADRIVGFGGTAVLTEVPEMFGAEQLLMNKCENIEVFEKYKKMIIDFKNFYIDQGFPVYENPSPGNKKGGITTLEEKSLGCIEKAGKTKITDVLDYGDIAVKKGINTLNAPGNDLIASTALGAAGCQIVLFTTGRGTPFSTFVPTMKISSNSILAMKKNNWIDFDAYDMNEEDFFDLILKTVCGDYRCKSENIREIAFYKKGVTL